MTSKHHEATRQLQSSQALERRRAETRRSGGARQGRRRAVRAGQWSAWSLCLALSLVSSAALAEPLFDANTECATVPYGLYTWSTDRDAPIHIYIEADFAAELNGCLADEDQAVTEREARNIIMSAAEVWNRETRATPFVWGGVINVEDANTASHYMTNKPAVFIQHEASPAPSTQGCPEVNGTALGSFSASAYNNVSRIKIYGADYAGISGCYLGYLIDWQTHDSLHSSSSLSLQNTLIHELGHALRLAHPDQIPGYPDASQGQSVMRSFTVASFQVEDHLDPWEMDCVDDPGWYGGGDHERDLRQRWIEADDLASGAVSSGYYVSRGFASGNMLRASSTTNWFGLYTDGWIRYEPSHSPPYTFQSWSAAPVTSVRDLYINPVLMSPLEKSGPNQRHRINYARKPTSFSDSPPQLAYRRSDDLFSSAQDGIYRACADPGSCTSSHDLESHIPLASTFDPISGHTLFAHVAIGYGGGLLDGDITIHPGFWPGLSWPGIEWLWGGTKLGDAISPPSGGFYDLRTETAPGIACLETNLSASEPWNCVIAWAERGDPNGRVLYAWFRVDPSTRALHFQGTASSRAGSRTVSDVSAGVINVNGQPRVALAWKTVSPSDVAYTINNGSRLSWTSVETLGRANVVDAPTWLYDQHANGGVLYSGALTWTEASPTDYY